MYGNRGTINKLLISGGVLILKTPPHLYKKRLKIANLISKNILSEVEKWRIRPFLIVAQKTEYRDISGQFFLKSHLILLRKNILVGKEADNVRAQTVRVQADFYRVKPVRAY